MWLKTGRGAAALSLTLAAGCAKGAGLSGDIDPGQGGSGGGGMSGVGGASGGSTGGGPGACSRGEECAALTDACNQGACVNGACARLPDPAREDGPCEDGLYCTDNDACHQGSCVGGAPRACPGADACNVGACDEATRSCAATPGNNGLPCQSDDACQLATICEDGLCGGGQPRDCTVFDDLCAVGVCDPQIGCKPEAKSDGSPCDAGQGHPCSGALCLGGQCQKVARNEGAPCDDKLSNPCTQGVCAAGDCQSGPSNEGGRCEDFLFCTDDDRCLSGVCAGDPNPCGPADGCFVFQCNEFAQACSSVPRSEGESCEDGNDCTTGTTCSGGLCGAGTPTNEGGPCKAGSCATGSICSAGVCGGGQGPTIYFQDDFRDDSRGWSLGPEWQIGSTAISTAGAYGAEPALDHTPSEDNGVAGVVIGGNEAPVAHPYYSLESPAFDTSAAAGPVFFGFYRWLNSDYAPYMHNRVEVYDGAQWIVLWESGASPTIQDSPPEEQGWTYVSYDVTSAKSAGMKVRFGYDIAQAGALTLGSWNVDDVLVASAACP